MVASTITWFLSGAKRQRLKSNMQKLGLSGRMLGETENFNFERIINMKQYVITPAYTGNDHVICVNNGKVESDTIVAYYELQGYTSALENMGYERAEYVPAFEADVKNAQKALDIAKEALENAKKRPLKISEEDARKYNLIRDICDWDDDD
jgi:hypothetical protein